MRFEISAMYFERSTGELAAFTLNTVDKDKSYCEFSDLVKRNYNRKYIEVSIKQSEPISEAANEPNDVTQQGDELLGGE